MKDGGVKIVISIVILILAFLGIYFFSQDDQVDTMMEEDMENNDVMMDEEMQQENSSMMEDDEVMMEDSSYTGEVLAGESVPLLDFNQSDYEKALQTDKLVVLYFYANWCPVCIKEVENALYPAFNEMDRNDVIGFRVNYNDNQTDNNEEELAREFGVAYQHTKVFVLNNERVLKAPDSWSKSRYLEEINSILN